MQAVVVVMPPAEKPGVYVRMVHKTPKIKEGFVVKAWVFMP
jgi:hypothetical protein